MDEKIDEHVIDDQLMQRVKHHDDEGAYTELVTRHYKKWTAFAMRMVRQQSVAQELVQETCLKIWDKRKSWQPDAKWSTWAYTIVYRCCLDFLKSKNNRLTLSYDENLSTTDNGLAEAVDLKNIENDELIIKIKQALDTLPAEHRALFILHYYHHLKQEELSELFHLSTSAIESILFRTRKKLREILR